MPDVNDIPDAELIRRVIATTADKRGGRHKVPLWNAVGNKFCLGSTYSAQLCCRFGFDPNEEVRA